MNNLKDSPPKFASEGNLLSKNRYSKVVILYCEGVIFVYFLKTFVK